MPRAGLTPDGLVRTAADLADAEGLDALTISALARRVGVRPASLYGHVAGADDLRVRVALLALQEMADLATTAAAGRSGHEALRAVADVYRDYARASPGRYAASRWPLDHATAAASAGPRHAALLGAVLRGYALPDAEHVHAVRALGASVHGFVQLEAAGSYAHSAPASDVSWDRLVDALDAMLRAWPRHPDRGPS